MRRDQSRHQNKFQKKVEKINLLISQLNDKDLFAVETDSSWESVYKFSQIKLMKTKLVLVYTKDYTTEVKDEINLTRDEEYDYIDTKEYLGWVQRCCKKGLRRG